jgi:galactokinase
MSEVVACYREIFGAAGAVRVARGPGRVNLIGEHTDYNGGLVMPMALDVAVRIAFVPQEEPTVTLWSEQFSEQASFALGAELSSRAPQGKLPATVPPWLVYPIQVAAVLAEAGVKLRGLRGVVQGDVPMGSGLSSSAAYEVAAALAMLAAARPEVLARAHGTPQLREGATGYLQLVPPDPHGLQASRGTHPIVTGGPWSATTVAAAHGLTTVRLAELCQQAEHRVGVRCGIMDQFISLHGQRGHAIILDCRSLAWRAVPLPTDRVKVVVIDSGVRRKLTAGAYNTRRSECEDGLSRLRRFDPALGELCDVTPALLAAHEKDLPPVVARRCRHVVTECGRVAESAEALAAGDVERFGRLINASHDSLRHDYEVSGPELDLLVEIARGVPGVLGSRLTGAGFGGCTVTLARPEAVDLLRAAVLERYRKETGLEPRVWVMEAADGAEVSEPRASPRHAGG